MNILFKYSLIGLLFCSVGCTDLPTRKIASTDNDPAAVAQPFLSDEIESGIQLLVDKKQIYPHLPPGPYTGKSKEIILTIYQYFFS